MSELSADILAPLGADQPPQLAARWLIGQARVALELEAVPEPQFPVVAGVEPVSAQHLYEVEDVVVVRRDIVVFGGLVRR